MCSVGKDLDIYFDWIVVIEYILVYDDGVLFKDFDCVDIILFGVLCSGKMFISLYMVM